MIQKTVSIAQPTENVPKLILSIVIRRIVEKVMEIVTIENVLQNSLVETTIFLTIIHFLRTVKVTLQSKFATKTVRWYFL